MQRLTSAGALPFERAAHAPQGGAGSRVWPGRGDKEEGERAARRGACPPLRLLPGRRAPGRYPARPSAGRGREALSAGWAWAEAGAAARGAALRGASWSGGVLTTGGCHPAGGPPAACCSLCQPRLAVLPGCRHCTHLVLPAPRPAALNRCRGNHFPIPPNRLPLVAEFPIVPTRMLHRRGLLG